MKLNTVTKLLNCAKASGFKVGAVLLCSSLLAIVACEKDALLMKSTNNSSQASQRSLKSCNCGDTQANKDCVASGKFTTYTQGGWGSKPNGNNPGVYVQNHFAAAFPEGLTVGCDIHSLTLTSAQAVSNFLPQGGTPGALTAGYTDPKVKLNVLAGQVVALTLSVGFDKTDANFGASNLNLGDLVIASGTFAGMTVKQVLAEANNVLGGCSSKYTASQLNDIITSINENFDNGTVNKGVLTCPPPSTDETPVVNPPVVVPPGDGENPPPIVGDPNTLPPVKDSTVTWWGQ
jgi:hypothetical protein